MQCRGIRPYENSVSCMHIRDAHQKLARFLRRGHLRVQRIMSGGISPQPIQIHEVTASKEPRKTDKFLLVHRPPAEPVVSPILAGKIRRKRYSPCRNPDEQIKGIEFFLQKRIENTGGKDASHPPAFYNQGCSSV